MLALSTVPVVVVPMVSLALSWLLLPIFYVLVNPFYRPNIPALSRQSVLLQHSPKSLLPTVSLTPPLTHSADTPKSVKFSDNKF